jgi:hypothetical protein
LSFSSLLAVAAAGTAAIAQDEGAPNPQRQAYFGDLHLHTGNSFDAASVGITMTRDDAYRYAQGEAIEYMGRMVQRRQRLDFLAITDHAEYMGVLPALRDPDGPFPELHAELEAEGGAAAGGMRPQGGLMARIMGSGFRSHPPEPVAELTTDQVTEAQWASVVADADKYNRPGEFTAFAGYEWSPTPDGNHYHRCIIFLGPEYPDRAFSSQDSMKARDLFAFIDAQRAAGADSVVIPHNPNLSGGLTFADSDEDGGLMTRDFAEMRARNELLAEVTQIKGTSETHPDLSPDDPFANFEIVRHVQRGEERPIEGSYIRDAYGRGLEIAARVGVNPFAFGLVGDTDSHASLSNNEEDNYVGSLGENDDPQRPDELLTRQNPVLSAPTAIISASGITGVWAEENTRESIFAALKRKETFATSGPRILVRLFAGWDFSEDLLEQDDWVATACADGVPMGGDITGAGDGQSPRFVVEAVKDAQGANLDRVQIVKVWFDGETSRERVFDVAWSGDRTPDASGAAPAVGDTVDVTTATYANDIGAATLQTVWQDPEFDPSQSAVYYARVIEIPTPRWTTYLAVRNGLPLPEALPATLQERAWTSPIFYTPG